MSQEIKAAIDAKLAEWNIAFTARYMGEMTRDNFGDKPWKCDAYRVKIGDFETDYYMGLGNRKMRKDVRPCAARRGTVAYAQWEKANMLPSAPSAANVLHSLLSDATAADRSFNDWANDYGYNSDSIKDRGVYDACCAIGVALRKVFTHAQRAELSELLQDY